MKNLLFPLLLLLGACNSPTPESQQPVTAGLESLFNEQRALTDVAFIAPYWRLPGNPGFDSAIYYIERQLQAAGYVAEAAATPDQRLVYRLEQRPMEEPAWEPVSASVLLNGQSEPLITFATNRNNIAINSASTPAEGITATVIDAGKGSEAELAALDVKGKIVYAETHPYRLYQRAVVQGGAAGILSYNMPAYTQPEKNTESIQFGSIPYDAEKRGFSLLLSHRARTALKKALAAGPVQARVQVQTNFIQKPELTIVAQLLGTTPTAGQFVYSAHVQEPGANDNASGVGVQLEMARTAAAMHRQGLLNPARSLSFLWGDEITSTRRYVQEKKGSKIVAGLSLDMVGQNTELTGGTFLIEKMPDPSAIWTRGEDKHTEWGAGDVGKDDLFPHFHERLHLAAHAAAGSGYRLGSGAKPF